MSDLFNQINTDVPVQCDAHQLFRQWTRKEITDDVYFTNTAIIVASKHSEYKPLKFDDIQMQPDLAAYVEDRSRGMRQEDVELGKRLGKWIFAVHHRVQENTANESLIRWSMGKLHDKKLASLGDRLQFFLKGFESTPLPDKFGMALIVQERDAGASQQVPREGRRG